MVRILVKVLQAFNSSLTIKGGAGMAWAEVAKKEQPSRGDLTVAVFSAGKGGRALRGPQAVLPSGAR